MKNLVFAIMLVLLVLVLCQPAVASDTDSSCVKWYLISSDTIATIEIPKGFKSIMSQEGVVTGRISYSDSCFIAYSIDPPFDHRLIMGADIEQRGTYNWNQWLHDSLDIRCNNPQKTVFYGRIRGASQFWHEDSVCFIGLPLIRIAAVGSTKEMYLALSRAINSIERYVSLPASLKLLESTTYRPNVNWVAGVYEYHTGFSGDVLTLKDDCSFTMNGYTDVVADGQPCPGYRGRYSIDGDTLKLVCEGYIIPANSSDQWKDKLLQEEGRVITDARNKANQPYLFKKAENHTFLVSCNELLSFALDAVKNGGGPELCGAKEPRYALYYFTKTK